MGFVSCAGIRKRIFKENRTEMPTQRFSPKEFLKNRRPERFSDSVGQDSPVLDRSLLEYHLYSITGRSGEVQFETFARRLLEHTVCLNLLPHTGPTGGGDSKVDSETYPVAEALALGWYMGIGTQAATERWAFAFSAKEVWLSKLKSDIAKIVATGRGYTKAFFVSNQSIPDKKRAEHEDKLWKKYGLDVRIFDRTYILDEVFKRHLEQLAIDELGMKTSIRREVRKGPLDTEREQDREGVEARIAAALQDSRHTPGLVADCLEAADLARSLEKPRVEVEGLYERADRLAKQFGTPHQQVQSAYGRAWTAFWWYEDYLAFVERYADFEERVRGSRNAYELELWTNLFFLLHGAVEQGALQADKVDINARSATLIANLDRLALEKERVSTALQARTSRLLIGLALAAPAARESILQQLAQVVRESELLIGYPLEPLVQMLTELGTVFGTLPAYEEVFETVVNTAARREGEVSAARMLLTRGAQQLDAARPYEAIRTLGRALGRLYKHESRHDAVHALYLCARAYEHVGLLWAARGTMLAAASIATNEFWTYDKTMPQQAICYNAIKWIELRLGRLPHLLAWHELDQVVRAALADRGYNMERLSKYDQSFDPILGMLLLRTDLFDLQSLAKLPHVLDGLELPGASIALRYALGHEDDLPPELFRQPVDAEGRRELFRKWRDQPAASEVAPKPQLYTHQTVTLSSMVLGCHIVVDCSNKSPCVELAESTLAAIESFLATGVLERMVAREPILTIKVRAADFANSPFTFETRDEDGRPHIEIRCPSFEPYELSHDEQHKVKERLFELVAHVLARAFMMRDPEPLLTKLFRDELVPQRALDFTTSFMVVGNVLGHKPKTTLVQWVEGDVKVYPLIREKVWDNGEQEQQAGLNSGNKIKLADPDAEPPAELTDPNTARHDKIQTVSLIRETLWDEAKWCGAAFAASPSEDAPPVLALLFSNATPAKKIFALWRTELGIRDDANKLRVAIIRGVIKANPHAYRMVVGSDPAGAFQKSDVKRVAVVSRINTMEPSSDENLKRFLNNYDLHKCYLLAFGIRNGDQADIAWDATLFKRQLIVRDAWEVGPNDIDSLAIQDDDDPIIPANQKNPPVLRTLVRRRKK